MCHWRRGLQVRSWLQESQYNSLLHLAWTHIDFITVLVIVYNFNYFRSLKSDEWSLISLSSDLISDIRYCQWINGNLHSIFFTFFNHSWLIFIEITHILNCYSWRKWTWTFINLMNWIAWFVESSTLRTKTPMSVFAMSILVTKATTPQECMTFQSLIHTWWDNHVFSLFV